MTKKIRTVVNLEIKETLMLKQRPVMVWKWCAACRAVRLMITTEDAASLFRTAPQAMDEWLKAGRAHSADLPDGSVGICFFSLLDLAEDFNQVERESPYS